MFYELFEHRALFRRLLPVVDRRAIESPDHDGRLSRTSTHNMACFTIHLHPQYGNIWQIHPQYGPPAQAHAGQPTCIVFPQISLSCESQLLYGVAGILLLPWKVVEQLVPTDPFEALVVDPVFSSSLSSSSWKPNLLNPCLFASWRP